MGFSVYVYETPTLAVVSTQFMETPNCVGASTPTQTATGVAPVVDRITSYITGAALEMDT
jgi:hypothetical protein